MADSVPERQATPRKRNATSDDSGRLPPSPLGATPRPPLRQDYENLHLLQNRSRNQGVLFQSHIDFTKDKQIENDFDSWDAGDLQFTGVRERKDGYTKGDTRRAVLILAAIFILAIVALGTAYWNFPKLEHDEVQFIKLPKNIEDAKNLGRVLSRYKDKYFYQVLGGFFITYVFLQTFAIPGSIFLSILSGFLFSFPLALFAVCLCSMLGASFCYGLSYLLGRTLVQRYIPGKAAEWQAHVNRHREHLLNYIIFLRITPFLPNWFINITAPVIHVPLYPFALGTFIGVAPPSFVAIQAGETLQELTSSGDTVSLTSVIILAVLAILSLLPVFFKKKLQQKFD